MIKKNIINVVTTVTLLSSFTLPVQAATSFVDIDNSYAKDAIQKLVNEGILNGIGEGKFSPTGTITRQDFAIVLAKALNLDTNHVPSTPTFSDIPPNHYAFKYIEAAVKAGLIKGNEDGTFGNGQNLSRQDMAVIFVRALGVDATGKAANLKFSDAASISDYAKDAVAYAVELGLLVGDSENSFNPKGIADRQAVALVTSKFLKAVEKHKAPDNPNNPTPSQQTPPPTNGNTGGGGGHGGSTPAVSPMIISITPSSGSIVGGNTVTITGTRLAGATAVKFGEASAVSFTVVSDTQITAVVPRGSAGAVTVSVTTPNGTASLTGGYTYAATSSITSISPSSGSVVGGNTVTITGTGLTGATAVKFGEASAVSFTVVSDTQITAVVPAGSGAVTVSVATPNGTASLTGGYTYAAASSITSISPSSGSTAGGNTVTITGTGLTGATAVKFGGVDAVSFTVDSDTQITTTVPAATTADTVTVSVTTPNGTANSVGGYTYVAASNPSITSISPSSGSTAGGNTVTITGTGLTGATAVKFGEASAVSFTVVSDTQITAVVPAGSAGAVTASVATPNGTASLTGGYTYATASSITSISPSSGPVVGGNTVTITGTGLTGATAVKFGETYATSFTINSSTQITATVPAGTAGAVNVSITTPIGTANLTNGYTYVSAANQAPTADNVVIKGTTMVGQTLTGSYTYNDAESDGEGTSTFKWYRADDEAGTNKVAITGATSKTYTLVSKDEGQYIFFEVTPVASTGTTTGAPVVSAANKIVTKTLFISEVVWGDGFLQGIELYNPTDEDIDATKVHIERSDGGDDITFSPESGAVIRSANTFTIGESIYSGEVNFDYYEMMGFYNDDSQSIQLKLYYGDQLLDIAEFVPYQSLGRISGTVRGNTNSYDSAEWINKGQGYTDDLNSYTP
ncbi:IPT/TIG domain-containing protein [Aneurinibacillus uraniidurans]|uniref:IPT/TIG domain-containing protein n=1 Tax=Aneurinibacillus uraniidurans TaxID=2966586 RepID=UPI00234BCAAB|nr:IPT/TIG domain-containing protein [Aneurinibacillus sp. B1]WCN37309.1 IPT/TIG domain-containing protein [Aneurinibacillus sp. B1]